jgi:transcriptional regulator with XRE-family HTH domain
MAREIRQVGQEELAKKAGLPPSSISHFECGRRKPSLRNLVRLADALEMSADFLLGRQETPGRAVEVEPAWQVFQKLSSEGREIVLKFLQALK